MERLYSRQLISAYALQMEGHPEDLIDYIKRINDTQLSEELFKRLKNNKPVMAFLENDGKLFHFNDSDDLNVTSELAVSEISFCENCPHGIPQDYYVICKRDNRRMSPYDFCSLSTDKELYHGYGIGVIHQYKAEE